MAEENAIACPFGDWTLYSPIEWTEVDQSGKTQVIYGAQQFRHAFLVPGVLLYDLKTSDSVTVDFAQLNNAFGDPNLPNFLENRPNLGLAVFAHTAHDLLLPRGDAKPHLPYSSSISDPNAEATDFDYPSKIVVRLINFPVDIEIRDIKSLAIDKLKSIRGTVVRVSSTKPILLQIGLRCNKCAALWLVHCQDGRPQQVHCCIRSECAGQEFTIMREYAVTTDWQRIRIQENAEASIQGAVPQSKEIEVLGNEVDRCVPGDVITVVGVIRANSMSETRGKGNRGIGRNGVAMPNPVSKKRKRDASHEDVPLQESERAKAPIYDTYIEANSVQNTRALPGNASVLTSASEVNNDLSLMSMAEMYGILQVANHPMPFALIVASICPTIYGHELVKAGIVLALFGGAHRQDDTYRDANLRSDVHVLIVGDPGLGKSQMLVSVNKLAPRSVYVCGSYASAAGLTVSIHKDAGSHDYTLEAGALVLANNGIACIDELDKMPNDLDALLEAMEQQQISVAKAGIVCNLPARATILAAANPRQGHYDKSKTISENLNMSTALLSRFDLIFVLLDKPNKEQDQKISEHIFKQHSEEARAKADISGHKVYQELVVNPNEPFPVPHMPAHKSNAEQNIAPRGANPLQSQPLVGPPSLLDRLKAYKPGTEEKGVLPTALLNKYIGYAKRFVQPVLTPSAKLVLQEFYLSLRRSHQSQDGTPVTTRQLESLIRLAEARAKVELRTEVTETDARDVIEIMKMSLRDALDPDGFEAVTVEATGKRGQGKLKSLFVNEVQKRARARGSPDFQKQELYEISKILKICPASSFEDFLEGLNLNGFFTRPNGHLWRIFGV